MLGVGTLALYGLLTWLSFAFVYGQGHVQRPIVLFMAVYAGIFICYGLAVYPLLSRTVQAPWGTAVALIVVFGLLFRATLFFSQPIQEDDFYRYLWDGAVVAEGNPYQFAPLRVQQHMDGAATETALRAYAQLAERDGRLSFVLSRVNHPHISTVYPPFAQAIFGLAAWLAPGSLSALRLVFVAFDLGLCALLLVLLNHLGLGPLLLAVYAWSPLIIKETMNSAHYDVVPAFCTVLAVVLMVKGRDVLAHISLAAAVLGKLYPVLLVPVFLARAWKTHGWGRALLGLSVTVAVLLLGYAPFWSAGQTLWTGTYTFAEQWQTNSLIFPGIVALVGERWLANGVVGLFLLSPVGNPWYFVCLVPFLAVFPLRSWLLLSGLLSLYYVSFYFLYRGRLETFHVWLEYVPFYGMLAWEWWQGEYGRRARELRQ